MVIQRLLRVVLLCACCVQVGCRIPKLFIPPPEPSLVYDTRFEQEIAGQTPPTVSERETDIRWRYRESLAEPVTAVAYDQPTESTWNILFATNRIPVKSPEGHRVEYGNRFDQQVHYGRCEVTLSHQEPDYEEPTGDDLKSKVTRILPMSWQKEIAHDLSDISEVRAVSETSTPAFFQELKAQVQRSRQHDVLLFVHGFNVDFAASVTRLAQLTKDLPFNGAVVAYSWPSQGGIANYPIDGEIINRSIPPFAEFLNALIHELPEDTRINIVVHSMGNRLVLRSLEHIQPRSPDHKPLANIVFCAPDVSVQEFHERGPQAVQLAERVTMYTCLNDSALIASAQLNNQERAGSTLPPTVVDGIETVECALLDTSMLGHSYYGSNHSILRDLFCILKEHQPASRRAWLKSQQNPYHNPYWIFQDFPTSIVWTWHFGEPGYIAKNSQPKHARAAIQQIAGEQSN